MKGIESITRFERKWIYNDNDYLPLINSLIRSKFFFKKQFPPRRVNSIYFDDNRLSSIRANLDGIRNKKKIRLRWYGKHSILYNPILEIKSKDGFVIKKINYKVDKLNGINFLNTENLKFIQNTINEIINPCCIIYPVLTTNYNRNYFISNNNIVRATVDYSLKSIYLKNLSQLDLMKNFPFKCILEIKYPTNVDTYVRYNLREMTLRLSKNSKFINSAVEKPTFIF